MDRTALDSAQGEPAAPRKDVFRSSLPSHLALIGTGSVNQNIFSGTDSEWIFTNIFLSLIGIIVGYFS